MSFTHQSLGNGIALAGAGLFSGLSVTTNAQNRVSRHRISRRRTSHTGQADDESPGTKPAEAVILQAMTGGDGSGLTVTDAQKTITRWR